MPYKQKYLLEKDRIGGNKETKDKRYSEPVEVGKKSNLKQPAQIKAVENTPHPTEKIRCCWVIKLYIIQRCKKTS